MNVTDMVYKQWSEDLQNRLEPPELSRIYRRFQYELERTTVMTPNRRDDIWEAMIECMTAASEFSFKEGFRAGMQIMTEARQ